jgi:cardiolipin synthase A/B
MPNKPAKKPRRYARWVIFLAVVGGLSITAAIVGLFFALGRRPSALDVTASPTVDSSEFLASVAGIAGSPLRAGGTVELLNNGDEFLPSLLQAIRAARKTINFLVFIWEPGKMSDQVFAALIERARAGVEVRVLLDGFGSLKAPEKDIAALRAAGGRLEFFRPPRFGKLTQFHKRTHRRAIVIDGVVAFTGGMAVGDKWLGNATTEDSWRDTMVRVTGPFANTIQSAFAAPWAHTAGEMLVGEQFYPTLPPAPITPGRALVQHVGVNSSPSPEDHPLRLFFMQTFLAAHKTLYITTPYFVPDRVLREGVAKKARSGVDVRILLPDEHTDAKPIRQTTHSYLQELMEAGVKIYEYQPTMMHTKHVVADGKWVIVGSTNMDVRSKELNDENALGILDPVLGARMDAIFFEDLKRAEEIRLETWKERGPFKRLIERTCRLFAEQY